MKLFSDRVPTTVLVGAGLSSVAPTSLPSWWDLNDAVLHALGDAVERITGRSGISDTFRHAIAQRRDGTPFLKPDLQAQLIEDEIGEAYFRALGHVNSTVINRAHELLAELTRQCRVGAIITTNFDCTIERALDSIGLNYQIYHSPADFADLPDDPLSLTVVKVHGSSSHPTTMVDTMRQRLHGRPDALNKWMLERFLKYPTLGIGFSGQDLQYDQNYLSIRPAVAQGAEFQFLVRQNPPSAPLRELSAAFPSLVNLVPGELPGWLFAAALFEGVNHAIPPESNYTEKVLEQRRSAAQEELQAGLKEWAGSLNKMEVINSVTALLASAGQRPTADYLLRRTWKFYRDTEDTTGPSYVRFLRNYGETLMRAAKFRNPYNRETDPHSWLEAADQDPGQFFFRAVKVGRNEAVWARYLLTRFLAFKPLSAVVQEAASLLEQIQEAPDPLSLTLIDASHSLSELLELCALGEAGAQILERSHQAATILGDEFRRSESGWRLARNLAFASNISASKDRISALADESTAIAQRLDIRESDAGSALARSIAASSNRDWPTAAREAKKAEIVYGELEDIYALSFAKRERVRALIGEGMNGATVLGAEFDELSTWLQQFALNHAPGMEPLIKFELSKLAIYFDKELSTQLAMDAIEGATAQEHPYIGGKAEELLSMLKEN